MTNNFNFMRDTLSHLDFPVYIRTPWDIINKQPGWKFGNVFTEGIAKDIRDNFDKMMHNSFHIPKTMLEEVSVPREKSVKIRDENG